MEKEYVITLILGLLVAAIAFGFITSNDGNSSNVEVCRQSVIVRDTIPNADLGKITTMINLKKEYPLNCETNVLEIDYEDTEKATEEILDSIVECWYMFGNGKLNLATSNIKGSSCSVCTRVHFDQEVEEYYINNPINLKQALNSEWKNDITYSTYLTAQVDGLVQNYYIAENSYTSENVLESDKGEVDKKETRFYLPEQVDISKGDFFITFRYFRYQSEYHYADILFFPYDDGEPFNLLAENGEDGYFKNNIIKSYHDMAVCEVWEGVPA